MIWWLACAPPHDTHETEPVGAADAEADADTDIDTDSDPTGPVDHDVDGFASEATGGDDCDDEDPQIFPGHGDLCDGVDNDCDDRVDEGAACWPEAWEGTASFVWEDYNGKSGACETAVAMTLRHTKGDAFSHCLDGDLGCGLYFTFLCVDDDLDAAGQTWGDTSCHFGETLELTGTAKPERVDVAFSGTTQCSASSAVVTRTGTITLAPSP